jgi:hypothetical protein
MTTNTRTHEDTEDQVARHGDDIAQRPGADGHRRLGAVLTHLGVLAALTEPEAAIALANGVPNLDDETLVRFLYDSRSAA